MDCIVRKILLTISFALLKLIVGPATKLENMQTYVTRSGKTVHFALFTEIKLLVSADAPFSAECGNTSYASFGRTVAKLRPRTAGTFADVRFWKSTFENCNENSAYFRIIITTVYLSCDYVIKFLRLRRNGDPRANKRRFASLIEST